MNPILASVALEPRRWAYPKFPAMSLHYLLPHIQQAGFDQVEIWQWHISRAPLDEVDIIKASADQLGIRFPYIGVYPRFHLEEHDQILQEESELMGLIERAKRLDTPCLKIMLGQIPSHAITQQQLQWLEERFGAWYKACRQAGLEIVVELHDNTLFEPWELGLKWLNEHPEFEIGICYQPIDFRSTEDCLHLAEQFKGRIRHVHLQGRKDMVFCPLSESDVDYRQLIPKLIQDNPKPSFTIEFVEHCTMEGPFDLAKVLRAAQKDATFAKSLFV